MKKKRRLKKKFIVFIFLYLFLLTSLLAFKTYSKYTGTINKTGNVTVAKWDVSANIPTSNINLIAGNNTENYLVTVTSDSEVATDYNIIVSNLPNYIQVALDDDNFIDVTGGQVVFNNAGSFNANAVNTSNTHTLKIKALIDAAAINRNISVDVTFIQKQIN